MTLRLRVERLSPEGQGLARPEGGGKVHFVPYAAPGDLIEAEVLLEKTGHAQARLLRVLEPGPGRLEPACPLHFKPGAGLFCGGCDWQHLSYPQQLAAKTELVRDCLRRIAKLPDANVPDAEASPQAWRYRNKVQIPFGLSGGGVVAGFYAPASHAIVDFKDCPVQPELSVRLTLKVKELAASLGWEIYDEKKRTGWLRHALVRTNQDGKALLALVSRTPDFPKKDPFLGALRDAFPDVLTLAQNVQSEPGSVILGRQWKIIWGGEKFPERIGSLRLELSPSAFLQINTPACEKLYGLIREALSREGFRPKLALDLYCGAGAIALYVADLAERVLGLEENRDAVEDARENARRNGAVNARFYAGKVETSLAFLRGHLGTLPARSSAAVLDPPRAGCPEALLKFLAHPALKRVVYVSCNPATLARDAAWLVKSGYALREARPVDMFPQTSHVECMALFERERT